jgi:hypothetical protein
VVFSYSDTGSSFSISAARVPLSVAQRTRAQHSTIVLLKTGFLGYWSENVSHACLLAGMTETAVFLHHPWHASGPVEVTRTEFIAAWTEMDYLAAIVAPAR